MLVTVFGGLRRGQLGQPQGGFPSAGARCPVALMAQRLGAAARAARPVPRLLLVTPEGAAKEPAGRDFEERLAAVAPFLDVLLVRDPSASSAQRASLGRRAREVFYARADSLACMPKLLIGEGDAEAAQGCGADGIHLPRCVWMSWGQGLPQAQQAAGCLRSQVRPMGGGLVSFAVHSPEEARLATLFTADLLLLGTLFPTASHPEPDYVTLGSGACSVARTTVSAALADGTASAGQPRPWLIGIGGVDLATCSLVTRAGADGCAVIRAVWKASDASLVCRQLRERMAEGLAERSAAEERPAP